MTYTKHQDIVVTMLKEVRQALGPVIFSAEIERHIEAKVRMAWGGQEVYVKKSAVDADARALEIRSRFNLRNRLELQAEFNISRGTFYKIIKGGG